MPAAASSVPVMVCDMGTGTTRLGYAGNGEPTFTLPTVCAWSDPLSYETLAVGHEVGRVCANTANSHRRSLLAHGVVTNWSLYEGYWGYLFHRYLCVEPSDVGLVLAEAAKAPPEQRETAAEILFESFGVAQLYIGSQALFALSSVESNDCNTALVVESGAGVTQVVPVVEGYVMHSAAQHFPIAGHDITQFILDSLRERVRGIEMECAWDIAEQIKKLYLYTAKDITKEIARFDADPSSHVVSHRAVHSCTGKPYTIDVGYERFLVPEVFFKPMLLRPEWSTSLPDLVDAVVQACPIDCRRRLYSNVVLCGGNARFPRFAKRLERALHSRLARRASGVMSASNGGVLKQVEYEVHVSDRSHDSNSVWRGESLFGSSARFATASVTRAEYEERGCMYSTDAACSV